MLTWNHHFFWESTHPPKFDSSPLNSYLPNIPIGNFIFQPSILRCKLLNFCGCSFPIDAPLKETTRCFKNIMEKMLGSFSETTYVWLKTSSSPHLQSHHRLSYHQTPWTAKVQRLFRRVGGRSCRVCAAFNRELSGSLLGAFFLVDVIEISLPLVVFLKGLSKWYRLWSAYIGWTFLFFFFWGEDTQNFVQCFGVSVHVG